MKKIALIVLGLIFAASVNAQIRWGVKAGGNMSQMTIKNDGEKVDGIKNRFGFHAGGMMEYSFSKEFALQPELMFMQNGTNFDNGAGSKGNITVNQIQIPVNLKYKLDAKEMMFFVTAGPYVGYGISGKLNNDGVGTSQDIYSSTDMGADREYKRFDFGAGVGLGVEFSKIVVGLGYQYGIANLTKIDKSTARLGTFQFSVGYFF